MRRHCIWAAVGIGLMAAGIVVLRGSRLPEDVSGRICFRRSVIAWGLSEDDSPTSGMFIVSLADRRTRLTEFPCVDGLTSARATDGLLGEAADGVWVLFAADDGQRHVDEIRIDGAYDPALSPSGDRVAYVSADAEPPCITIADIGPAGVASPVSIPTPAEWGLRYPCWSPDGLHIAFESDYMLFICDTQTLTARPLGGDSSTCQASQPSWSPDGATIAFYMRRPGAVFALATVDARSGQVGPSLSPASPYGRPAWSPDGRHLAYPRDDGLWPARVSDGALFQLTSPKHTEGPPDRWPVWLD